MELPARLKPFRFTKENAVEMGKRSAQARRKTPFNLESVKLIENESQLGADKFLESLLRRVRKEILLANIAVDNETKRYRPDPRKLKALNDWRSKLFDEERKLCGFAISSQKSTQRDPSKHDSQLTEPSV